MPVCPGFCPRGCGPSTIRICPPLVVTKEEADVALDVLEECIQEEGK